MIRRFQLFIFKYLQVTCLGSDQLLLTGSHPTIAATWNANEAKLTLTGLGGGPASYTDIIAAVYDVVFISNNLDAGGKDLFINCGVCELFSFNRSLLRLCTLKFD